VGFKQELPDYEMYTPTTPNYDDRLEDKREYQKKFRCPFRKEEDGCKCNQKHDNLNEILNHFYKYHFGRISSGNVFEENLNCFYTTCHDTFSTHRKLVNHIHKHEDGKESRFHIKFLIDNLEKETLNTTEDLKALFQAEKLDIENLLTESKKEKDSLVEEHASKLESMETEKIESESKLKGDIRHYKKKCDDAKKRLESTSKALEVKESALEDLKQKTNNISKDLTNSIMANEESDRKWKVKLNDLHERNAELRGKFSIQQETTQELKIKLEKLNHKFSNQGPNCESSLVRRNAKLERQLEMAKKQIKAKETELKMKDGQIFNLQFDNSDEEVCNASSINDCGEYVEED